MTINQARELSTDLAERLHGTDFADAAAQLRTAVDDLARALETVGIVIASVAPTLAAVGAQSLAPAPPPPVRSAPAA